MCLKLRYLRTITLKYTNKRIEDHALAVGLLLLYFFMDLQNNAQLQIIVQEL